MRIVIIRTFAVKIYSSTRPIFLNLKNRKENHQPHFHQIVTKLKVPTIIVRNMASARIIFNLIINLNVRLLAEWIVLK